MTKQLLTIIVVLLFLACGPSVKTTSTWVNKNNVSLINRHYKIILIAVITSKIEVRTKLENELAIAAKKHGYIAIKSIDKFPPLASGKQPTQEEIFGIVTKVHADAIFTTALVDKTSETRYVPGTTTYTPSVNSGFRDYYGTAWIYYAPNYYTVDKTYFYESSLFDAVTEKLIWSAQSEIYNPTNIEKTSQKYTELMITKMEKDGILKPTPD